MIFDNPEFIRLQRSKLRPRSMLIYGVLAAVAVSVIFASIYSAYSASAMSRRTPLPYGLIFNTCFYTGFGLQLFVTGPYCISLASHNIVLERERYTLDFQRLVGMGPWRLACGKLFGAPVEAFWMGLSISPFVLIAALGSGLGAFVWLESQVIIFGFGLFACSLGLFCSAVSQKASQATGVMMVISFVFYYVFNAWSGMTIWASANPLMAFYTLEPRPGRPGTFEFLGADVPSIIGFVFMNGVMTLSFLRLTARRLADPDLSFLTTAHAFVLFAVVQFLLIAGNQALFSANASIGLVVYHSGSAILLLALAFGLAPSAELLRGRISRGVRNEQLKIFLERGNPLQDSPSLAVLITFAVAYLIVAVALSGAWKFLQPEGIGAAIMCAAFSIAVSATLLYLQLTTHGNGFKAGLGIVLAALVVPPILLVLGAYLAPEQIMLDDICRVSPIGYLVKLGRNQSWASLNSSRRSGVADVWCMPLICTVSAILLSILCIVRIRFLLDLQDGMRLRAAEAVPPVISNPPAEIRKARSLAAEAATISSDTDSTSES